MADDERDPDEPEEGEPLAGHAARAAGERLREIADAEHARVTADAAPLESEAEHRVGGAASAATPHPLAAYAEPITDENLASLGDAAAGMAPCPFCGGYGAVDPDTLLAALPEVVQALAPFPASTVFVRCDECDGWGSVLTGGRTGDNGIQPCPKCHSHGYLDTRESAAMNAAGGDHLFTPGAPREFQDGDPFTLPPPGGVPPAAGMEWDAELARWQYPTRAA